MGSRLVAAAAAAIVSFGSINAAQAMPQLGVPEVRADVHEVRGRRHYHRDRDRDWGDRHGDAAIAGIVGLTTGLIIGNAYASPPTRYYSGGGTYQRRVYTPGYPSYTPPYRQPYYSGGGDWVSYCFNKYGPSYDPGSNSYLAVNGRRYGCH